MKQLKESLELPKINTISYMSIVILLMLLSSCSLVKIESEQKPLGVRELNTRLLTQNFARTAMDRVD